MKCPKCSYERQPTDEAPEWQCPSCTVAYVKVMQAQNVSSQKADDYNNNIDPPGLYENDSSDEELLVAQGQKIVIYSLLLNFLLNVFEARAVLPNIVIQILFICNAIYSLRGVLKICSGLGNTQNQKIVFLVLSFVPLINLITLLYLNLKATKMLRNAGWEVGLLGVKE